MEVALKVLYTGRGSSDPDRLRRESRLLREPRLLRESRDPGILRTHDIGSADGFLFTVSELLEGESLRERLRRSGPLPAAEAETILRGALSAPAVAHDAGAIHRDIKPGNIFLTREAEGSDGRVVPPIAEKDAAQAAAVTEMPDPAQRFRERAEKRSPSVLTD